MRHPHFLADDPLLLVAGQMRTGLTATLTPSSCRDGTATCRRVLIQSRDRNRANRIDRPLLLCACLVYDRERSDAFGEALDLSSFRRPTPHFHPPPPPPLALPSLRSSSVLRITILFAECLPTPFSFFRSPLSIALFSLQDLSLLHTESTLNEKC